MRLPGGHSAKEPPAGTGVPPKVGVVVHRSPPDTDCPIEPLKSQPWRVDAKQTTQSIAQDGQGRWILAAEANDGHRWEVDATEAVQAAAAHETETLRKELEILLRAVDREALAAAEKSARIQELEQENELARGWIQQYYDKYGDPGS